MTREEYALLKDRYQQFEPALTPQTMDEIVQLQDMVLRVMAQNGGRELFWEEETSGRVARQETFAALAQHGK